MQALRGFESHPLRHSDEGVRVFDGKTWRQYLDGDVIDMEIAPKGRQRVLTRGDLYVITPDAVTATE